MKNLMLVLFASGLFACTNSRNYAQAVVALVDVSGTYADQKPDVVNVIKRGILPKLMPGDSLYVIRIDDESYKKDNVEADLNLDVRPRGRTRRSSPSRASWRTSPTARSAPATPTSAAR